MTQWLLHGIDAGAVGGSLYFAAVPLVIVQRGPYVAVGARAGRQQIGTLLHVAKNAAFPLKKIALHRASFVQYGPSGFFGLRKSCFNGQSLRPYFLVEPPEVG